MSVCHSLTCYDVSNETPHHVTWICQWTCQPCKMKFVLISFYGFVDTSFYNCQLSTAMSSVPSSPLSTRSDSKEFLGPERIPGRRPRKATEGHGCWPRVLKTTWFVENAQYVLNMCKMLQCTYYVHMCIEAERTTQSTVLFREHGEWMWMSVLWMSGDVKTSQAKEAKLQSWVFHSFRLKIEETQEKESKERKTRVSN